MKGDQSFQKLRKELRFLKREKEKLAYESKEPIQSQAENLDIFQQARFNINLYHTVMLARPFL